MNQTTTCPPPDVLATFTSGRLAEVEADSVVAHLEACADCQQRVDQLAPRGDSLVRALRRASAPTSDAPEQLERLMQAAAHRETLPPSGSRTKTAKTASDTVNLETFVAGVRQSGVVDPSEVDELFETLHPGDARAFARALVKQDILTKFQAQAILQGRHQHLVLGSYIVLEPLGEGGMGRVYKARHRQLGRIVCVKVLHAADRKSPQLVERFRREAQTVANLQHPNIVVAHEFDESDGMPYIAMEFIDGADLARHVEAHGPLAPTDAAQVCLQAAGALEYAHGRGVVHRDVKPSNILLASNGRDASGEALLAKVLDLGLARFDSLLSDSPDALVHTSMTATGVVMGTVDYMSPEQALNSRKADHRSDIYSLGCTLHFLLTGRVMYTGETVMEKLIAHRERAIPSLIDAGAQVPASLDAIFQRMVAKAPDERYPSMTAVAEDLRLFSGGEMPQAMQMASAPLIVEAPPLPDLAVRRRRQAIAMGLAVAAMVLVMIAGGWMVANTDWREVLGPVVAIESDDGEAATVSSEGNAQPMRTIVGHPDTLANNGPGRALLVVPHGWFYEDHYQSVRDALAQRGVSVQVASSTTAPAKPKHGAIQPVPVDMTLDQFNANDFDAVFFLGGNVYEFTHKNGKVGEQAKAVVTASLYSGRVVAGVGNGWDAVKDTGLCQECKFEADGQLQKGKSNDGRTGTLLVAKQSDQAGELVAAALAALTKASP